MQSTGEIEHKGVITDIEGKVVEVAVTAESACGACQIRSACGMSEAEEKSVAVWTEVPQLYSIGEEVMVSIKKEMGIKAAVYAYIYPFFLLLGTVVLLLHVFELGEVVSGLTGLGVTALYYVGLAIFRHRIEKEIIFKIRKI